MTDAPRRYAFPRSARVRRRAEFVDIRKRGKSIRDDVLRIGYLPGGAGPSRIGLAVSRRVGNAVARNRVKRVIREAFRTSPDLFPAGLSLVVIPLDPRRARRLDDVRRSLQGLARRIAKRLEPKP